MSKVLLKYWFIFDSDEVWPRQEMFNSDLNKLFRARGVKVVEVERMMEDTEEIIMYLEPEPQVPESPQPKKELQPELKQALE